MSFTKNVIVPTSFLSLSPIQSTPPSSPTSTKALPSPVEGQTPTIAELIEPLSKVRRSSSESSTSEGFLKLNPMESED